MPSQTAAPYSYNDAQGHRLTLLPTHNSERRPFVWVEAENLAVGGDIVSMWLTLDQLAEVDTALERAAAYDAPPDYSATDHTGDVLTVCPGQTWTVFEVTRQASHDDEAALVRVVVLTARLPEMRAALAAAARQAQQRAKDGRERRVLTPDEHDGAWHAIEGAAGEPGADPGTVLRAVLDALDIQAPSAEDEQAASAELRERLASDRARRRGW
ncbi:hypothetical protein [Streptomyces chartreusis]|uniref:hypothetical protein n=1 Tax=Streptomyces chartreusis TaxID=1969 RepID=UPI003648BE56